MTTELTANVIRDILDRVDDLAAGLSSEDFERGHEACKSKVKSILEEYQNK